MCTQVFTEIKLFLTGKPTETKFLHLLVNKYLKILNTLYYSCNLLVLYRKDSQIMYTRDTSLPCC